MSYDNFKKRICEKLTNKVQSGVTVEQKEIKKNNGIKLDAILLHNNSRQLSSCLYLNDYYEMFKEGIAEDEIIEDILNIVNESKGVVEQQLTIARSITNFESIEDFICYKLVNTKMNEALLKTVPHKIFLDLAIVYFVVSKMDQDGMGTILIQNSFLDEWKCSLEELHEKAVKNTPTIFPSKIRSLEEVFLEMLDGEGKDLELNNESSRMYVVSNYKNFQGAGAILYPNLLRDFCNTLSEKIKGLVILPSSIHEQIIIPYTNDMEVDSLEEMVREINSTQVAREEVLSDLVYFYDPNTNSFNYLKTVSKSKEPKS